MNPIIKKYNIIFFSCLFGVLVTLFVLGSFYDLNLSNFAYDKDSIFGMIFASYGELPAWFALSIVAVMLYKLAALSEKVSKKILYNALAICFVLVSTFMIYVCESNEWNGLVKLLDIGYLILIAVFIEGVFIAIGFLIVTTNDPNLLMRGIIAFTLVVVLEAIIVNILKITWNRPRFRLIFGGISEYSTGDLFQAWWQPGNGLARSIYSGEPSEQFKSFPSGHTSDAATSFLWFFLPSFNIKVKAKPVIRIFAMILALIWTFTVAYSRIVYGAHYLTDVTFGFIISIVTVLGVSIFTRIF